MHYIRLHVLAQPKQQSTRNQTRQTPIQRMSNTTDTATTEDGSFFETMFGEGEIPDYPEDTLAPMACAAQMHDSTQTYWDLLYAMMALAMLTILVPYLFFCCTKRFRCIAWIYFVSGLVKIICGILLATALVPECPLECGAFFCSLHEYNPGPLYGCIVMVVGVLWLLKGCTLRMKGTRAELALEKAKAAAAAGGTGDGTDVNGTADVGTGYNENEEEMGLAEML